jgi:hypothetical protein
MDNATLKQHASDLAVLIDGLTHRQVDPVIARLAQEGQWELMGIALITAQEVPARAILECLLENKQFGELVPCACFRRQLRQATLLGRGALGAGVFRDFDTDEGGEGVPDHIMAEAEDIAAAAASRRATASVQSANLDRDALRTFVVTRLSERILTDRPAVEALIIIALASAFEDTRREAAMKIANARRLVAALVKAGRLTELIGVAQNTALTSAKQNLAAAMAADFDRWRAEPNRSALEFIRENHPEEGMRAAAQAVLG